MSRQNSQVSSNYSDTSKLRSDSNSIIKKISTFTTIIKSAFYYHLCFVVLSILHHRVNEQRAGQGGGEKNKKKHDFSGAAL